MIYMTNPILRDNLGLRDSLKSEKPAYLAGFLRGFLATLGFGGVASILRNTSSALGLGCDLFMIGA